MAHLIDMSNDRANMAYVGDKPWHGLGSELQPGADLETWRIAAGLSWEAASTDILTRANGKAMGSQYRAAQGTAWGLVNAVTEYVDHTQGHNTESRFKSAQFGQGAALKATAWMMGLALAA